MLGAAMFETIGAAAIAIGLLGLAFAVMGVCAFLIVRREERDG